MRGECGASAATQATPELPPSRPSHLRAAREPPASRAVRATPGHPWCHAATIPAADVNDGPRRDSVGISNTAELHDASRPEMVEFSSPVGGNDRCMFRTPTRLEFGARAARRPGRFGARPPDEAGAGRPTWLAQDRMVQDPPGNPESKAAIASAPCADMLEAIKASPTDPTVPLPQRSSHRST